MSKYEAEHSLAEEIPGLQVKETEKRIVIVGAGPAGLLCAYFLASCGYKPILIERGGPMMERMQKVAHFWKSGTRSPDQRFLRRGRSRYIFGWKAEYRGKR